LCEVGPELVGRRVQKIGQKADFLFLKIEDLTKNKKEVRLK
jgi:hypothetical protein